MLQQVVTENLVILQFRSCLHPESLGILRGETVMIEADFRMNNGMTLKDDWLNLFGVTLNNVM